MLTVWLLLSSADATGWERLPAPPGADVRGVAASADSWFVLDQDRAVWRWADRWEPVPTQPADRAADGLIGGDDGSVWLVRNEPPWVRRLHPEPMPRGEAAGPQMIRRVQVDEDGRVWAFGLWGTVAVRDGDGWTELRGGRGSSVASAVPDGSGGMWAVTDSDLWHATDRVVRVGPVPEVGSLALVDGRLLLAGDRLWERAGAEWTPLDDTTGRLPRRGEHVWRLTGEGVAPFGADPVPLPHADVRVCPRLDGALLAHHDDELWTLGAVPAVPLQAADERWTPADLGERSWPVDLDADGRDDLIVDVGDGLRWLRQADGVFVDHTVGGALPSTVDATRVLPCDVSGDGRPDLVVRDDTGWHLWLNRGDRLEDVTARAGLEPLRPYTGIPTCADLDVDGALDVLLTTGERLTTLRAVVWLRNRGHGRLQRVPLAHRGLAASDTFAQHVLVRDLDDDTFPDPLILANWADGHRLYRGGPGGLTDVTASSGLHRTYDTPRAAGVHDWDADGRLDLVLVSTTAVRAWRGTGPLQFEDATDAWGLAGAAAPRSGQVVDLGGDAAPDVLACGPGPCALWIWADGRFVDRTRGLPSLSGAPTVLDLGGDGDLDLIVHRDGADAVFERVDPGPGREPARVWAGPAHRLTWIPLLPDGLVWVAVAGLWLAVGVRARRERAPAGHPLVAVVALGVAVAVVLSTADRVVGVRLGAMAGTGLLGLVVVTWAVRRHRERAARRIGGYVLEGVLGRGGMGTVYAARDPRSGRPVAVKVVDPALMTTAADRALYRREAELGARLDSARVVRILGWGEWTVPDPGGQPVPTAFLVMERLDGQPLRALAEAPQPSGAAAALVRELALGLAAVHAAGIVHRDVKPDNVMLTRDGVKLMDFGAAQRVGHHTRSARQVLGTAGYLPPEQARGRPPDPRADVYAAGVVLYELLAGRRPFDAPDLLALLALVLAEPPPPVGRSLPDGLQAVLDRALAKDPDDRFPSAAALADALAPFAGALPDVPGGRAVATPLPPVVAPSHASLIWRLFVRYARYATGGGPPDLEAFARTLLGDVPEPPPPVERPATVAETWTGDP